MHVTFENRIDAGQQLAEHLLHLREESDVIVLGLPRGGVPVAAEVANTINAPLDVLLVRKIGTPGREELAMGAIASGDQIVMDDQIITEFGVTEDQIQQTIERERNVLHAREQRYRGDRMHPELRGKNVIIIDDGLATGSTMLVAIQAVRQQQPAGIVVGVPVGAPDTVEMIGREVDHIECVSSPPGFRAVGQWYRDFLPVSDNEVVTALGRP